MSNAEKEDKKEEAMKMLFSAKWNVPQAALHYGTTWEQAMVDFREYCKNHPLCYDAFGNPTRL